MSVREPYPVIGGALGRKRRAKLGGDEPIWDQEGQAGDDQPEDRLGPVRRRLADRVERHDRADREEDHVEAEERLFELSLLSDKPSYGCLFPHRLPSPKIPTKSEAPPVISRGPLRHSERWYLLTDG